MPSTKCSAVAELERSVRAYLATHPAAADSASGIRRWWLRDDLACASITDLETALKTIVATGALTEHRLLDGSVVYSATNHTGM
jgi:hypothetical protein